MMNDTTLMQIAAVKAMVNKGKPHLDIEPHLTRLLELAPIVTMAESNDCVSVIL